MASSFCNRHPSSDGTEAMPEINHKGFAHFSFSIRSFPVRVGGDDGDGVLDTATTVKIIVTTVTHRHSALKLVLR